MPRADISRRRFLANASAAASGLGLAAAVARGAPGANERMSIGIIGCGGRGTDHMQSIIRFAEKQNARITAVCDVWKVNLERAAAAAAKAFGEEPRKFTRFGEMLELKDLHGVTIATPDFSHGPILVAALKAGKDVYIEKPMTIQLSYANDALDLARKNDCVVQCGTQYRSQPVLIGVAKEVAAGAVGKISRVSSAVSFNHPRWKRNEQNCQAADVDWDAYLLDLPKRPFDASLLREWQIHDETSNGLPGLWMTHYVDATAMMMNAKYPSTGAAHGGTYVWKDGREHTDTITVLLGYPEGFLFDWAMSLGTNADWRYCIYGVDGTIEPQGNPSLAGNDWQVSARGGTKESKVATRKIEPVPVNDHMENWLECMRSRQRPRADIQFGHQHAVASILSATALTSGKRQKYDPATRTISPACAGDDAETPATAGKLRRGERQSGVENLPAVRRCSGIVVRNDTKTEGRRQLL
ncbi:MAG: Gfo/Idh/MocA family oxidoreductase [Planctomycetes bacterium]|nr:Gfo/Idh/MocA family oxidoreductase [Planctomycetota bacterium]